MDAQKVTAISLKYISGIRYDGLRVLGCLLNKGLYEPHDWCMVWGKPDPKLKTPHLPTKDLQTNSCFASSTTHKPKMNHLKSHPANDMNH